MVMRADRNVRILHINKGFKEIVRQPVRCFLFLLLLSFVAASGCLGISLWQTAERMLTAAASQYRIRVTFSAAAGGQAVWDEEALLADEAVLCKNEVVSGAGEIAGISNQRNEEVKELAILSFRVVDISEQTLSGDMAEKNTRIMALVQDVLYGNVKTQQYILLNTTEELPGDLSGQFVVGDTYFAYGTYQYTTGNYPVFTIKAPEWQAAEQAEVDLSVLPPLWNITADGEPADMELWRQFADTLKRTAALHAVYAMDTAELWDEFYEKRTELVAGEIFTEKASAECMIDDRFAAKHNLSVGDELTLRFFYREDGTVSQLVWGEEGAEAVSAEKYRITGIYRYQDELENALYITRPREASQQGIEKNVLQVRLKNSEAARFAEKYAAVLPEGVEIRIEDQGYAQAIAPVEAMHRQAVGLTVLGAILGFAALTFTGRNFYGHTAAQLKYLRELGGSSRDCLRYLLGGQLFAVTLGGAAGFAAQLCILHPLMEWLLEKNSLKYARNLRYSQLAETGSTDMTDYAGAFPAAGLLFVLFMELLAFVIAYRYCKKMQSGNLARRKGKKNEKRTEAMKKRGSGIPNVILRFGVREFWRSPGQSAVFLLLAFMLTVLAGAVRLAGEQQDFSLAAAYEQQGVSGYVTAHAKRSKADTTIALTSVLPLLQSGRGGERQNREFGERLLQEVYWQELSQEESCRLANDLYREWRASLLAGQDYIEDFGLSVRLGYEYMGTVETAADMPDIPYHTNIYGNDWLLNKIPSMPQIVFADSFACLEGAAGLRAGAVFAEGYGEEFLGRSEMICMASEGFIEENGLSLGDAVRFAVYTDYYGARLAILDVRIVGTCEGEGTEIYMPAGILYGTAFLPDIGYGSWQEKLCGYRRLKTETIRSFYGSDIMNELSSFRFFIKDNRQLDAFRKRLEEIGYSEINEVHELRQVVVIEDGMFLEALFRIQGYKEQLGIIFGLLLAVMLGMIAAASFLCVNRQREELFLMEELGTPGRHMIFCWLMRYGMAVLGGMIPGTAVCGAAAWYGGYTFPVKWFLIEFAEFAAMLILAVCMAILRIRRDMK